MYFNYKKELTEEYIKRFKILPMIGLLLIMFKGKAATICKTGNAITRDSHIFTQLFFKI